MTTFDCADCGRVLPRKTEGGTGYAVAPLGPFVCYDCCGEHDRNNLIGETRATLYLVTREEPDGRRTYYVTNWPGTFSRRVRGLTTGRHNMAGRRYDFAFTHAGQEWRGTQYGDNTQIAHCRKVKGRR